MDSGQGCHTLYLSRRHQILIVIKHFNTSTHAPKTLSSPVNLCKGISGVWPRLLQKRGPKAMLSSVRIVIVGCKKIASYLSINSIRSASGYRYPPEPEGQKRCRLSCQYKFDISIFYCGKFVPFVQTPKSSRALALHVSFIIVMMKLTCEHCEASARLWFACISISKQHLCIFGQFSNLQVVSSILAVL